MITLTILLRLFDKGLVAAAALGLQSVRWAEQSFCCHVPGADGAPPDTPSFWLPGSITAEESFCAMAHYLYTQFKCSARSRYASRSTV
jgi:hypothetical protein